MAEKGAAPGQKRGKKEKKDKQQVEPRQKKLAFNLHTWAERKLRRIIRSNGQAAARKWAEAHSDEESATPKKILAKLLKERQAGQAKTPYQRGVEKYQAPKKTPRPRLQKPILAPTFVITSGLPALTMPLAVVPVTNLDILFGEIASWLDKVSPTWRKRKKRTKVVAKVRHRAKVVAKPKPKTRRVSAKKSIADFLRKSTSASSAT